MTSKTHYVQVAAAIRAEMDDLPQLDPTRDALLRLSGRLAAIYERENPRFDRERFFAAASNA